MSNNKMKAKQLIAQLVVDARLGKTGITNQAISDLMSIISDIEHDVIKVQLAKVEALVPQPNPVSEPTTEELQLEAMWRQLELVQDLDSNDVA